MPCNLIWEYLFNVFELGHNAAQSAGEVAVEYTNCISAKG